MSAAPSRACAKSRRSSSTVLLCPVRYASSELVWSSAPRDAKTLLGNRTHGMNATASPAVSEQESTGTRLRNFAIGSLFALVLLIPKLLRLRHNAQTWLAFRLLLATAGAALVILPLSIANSGFAAIAGLAMFLAAILLPPAKLDHSIAEKTKELEALVVVNGGQYQPVNGVTTPVQLFVGADRVYALDANLHLLLVIPVAEIFSSNAAESRERWILRICWMDQTADFEYQGIFAEHLARVTESTIRGVMRSPLPVLRQSRAARA